MRRRSETESRSRSGLGHDHHAKSQRRKEGQGCLVSLSGVQGRNPDATFLEKAVKRATPIRIGLDSVGNAIVGETSMRGRSKAASRCRSGLEHDHHAKSQRRNEG